MTITEFCSYFEDKKEHYPISDSFVRDGYMKSNRGYIANAKLAGIKRDTEKAEPNQKWHLLHSYFPSMDSNREASHCYKYLACPELLLWIAEAAGFDIEALADEAKFLIKDGTSGHARAAAGRHIKTKITWEMLEEKLTANE